MSKAKLNLLRAALEQIALNAPATLAPELGQVAQNALDTAAAMDEYRITARTWYGRNGGEYVAELRRTDSGETVFRVEGTTWGSDAWAYDMRDALHAKMPDVFPDAGRTNPTIYFREMGIEYDHREVPRKKDL